MRKVSDKEVGEQFVKHRLRMRDEEIRFEYLETQNHYGCVS